MTWKGFLTESKSFMCYDSLSPLGKLKFWIKYQFAYARYAYAMYFDWRVRGMLQERKEWEETLKE